MYHFMFPTSWGIFRVKLPTCALKDCFLYSSCPKKGSVFLSPHALMFLIKLIRLLEKGCYKCN